MAANATLEKRLSLLEKEVAELKRAVFQPTAKPGWLAKVAGSFKDDPDFDEILRLGREHRKSDSVKEADL